MNARFIPIATAALMSTSAFAAEPVKPPVQPAAQPQPAHAQVMLASADDVRTPSAADQQVPASQERPRGRVTTCRCGDPQPQPEQ
jgi:hypothetical protein